MANQFNVPEGLKEPNPKIRVLVQRTFDGQIARAADYSTAGRAKTPGKAKSYFEFLELVKQALDNYQSRQNKSEERQVRFTWEKIDDIAETEVISIQLLERVPGSFSRGGPGEGSTKNLVPLLRENIQDPDNPGYRLAVLGKWYDNLIEFTTWAQTNKEAIQLSFWFQEFMDKYSWFFAASGVPRVIFVEEKEAKVEDNDGQKLYGRSLTYFVKTEEITHLAEKELEEIIVSLNLTLS